MNFEILFPFGLWVLRTRSFDGYTDSAKVAAIITKLREMEWEVPNENEIEMALHKAKGDQQQATDALTAMS